MTEKAQEARNMCKYTIPGPHFRDEVFFMPSNGFSAGGRREAMTKHAEIPGNSSVV